MGNTKIKTEHIKIIAGVIGSGKSTLIKFLGGHEGSKIQHLNENCDLSAATALLKMDYENNDLVILEEFHRLDEAFCQFLPDLIRFLENRNKKLLLVCQSTKNLKSLEVIEVKAFRLFPVVANLT